jgi:hypothetical protein
MVAAGVGGANKVESQSIGAGTSDANGKGIGSIGNGDGNGSCYGGSGAAAPPPRAAMSVQAADHVPRSALDTLLAHIIASNLALSN